MPLYHVSLRIPPKTLQGSAVAETLTIAGPVIQGGVIRIPKGCVNAVYVRITNYGKQLIPVYGWITGDGISIPIGRHELTGPDWNLVFEGYSMARDWTHTIRFDVYT